MAKHMIFCCMLVLFTDSLMHINGLPTDIAAKPPGDPCINGAAIQCLRCVRPEEYTGPCGCPMCTSTDPCHGVVCTMQMCNVPMETAALRTSPIRPLPGNCCTCG